MPSNTDNNNPSTSSPHSSLELHHQLQTTSSPMATYVSSIRVNSQDHSPELHLSLGSSSYFVEKATDDEGLSRCCTTVREKQEPSSCFVLASRVKEEAEEQLKLAVAEKAYAEEARRQAKRQIEVAEQEFMSAKRIRQQAQEELEKAQALRAEATKQVNSTILQITCCSCKHKFQAAKSSSSPSSPDQDYKEQ